MSGIPIPSIVHGLEYIYIYKPVFPSLIKISSNIKFIECSVPLPSKQNPPAQRHVPPTCLLCYLSNLVCFSEFRRPDSRERKRGNALRWRHWLPTLLHVCRQERDPKLPPIIPSPPPPLFLVAVTLSLDQVLLSSDLTFS